MPFSRKVINQKVKGGGRSSLNSERNGHVSSSLPVNEVANLSAECETKLIYHKPVPQFPTMTTMQFELLLVVYMMAALAIQYISIYKTNFHIIDYHLIMFISLILVRRVAWLVFKQTLASAVLMTTTYWIRVTFKGIVLLLLLGVTVWSFWHVVQHSYIEDVLFLCYPFGVYLWTFGITLNPYGHKVLVKLSHHQKQDVQDLITNNSSLLLQANLPGHRSNGQANGPSISPKLTPKYSNGNTRMKHGSKTTDDATQNGSVSEMNCCEMEHCILSPESVRYETESLRTDFNLRIKQAFFNSVISAYYVGFIPIKFTQNGYIFFDVWWSAQNILFVWINSFIMLLSQLMPFSYLDGLYRCATHLGSWKKYKGHRDTPYIWSALKVWPESILVKHNKCVYKALGKQNVAVPGDTHHSRFYYMFQTPLRLLNWLLLTQTLSVSYQLYTLLRSFHWYQVISLVGLLPFHYFILFILLRQKWAVQANLEEHEACGS